MVTIRTNAVSRGRGIVRARTHVIETTQVTWGDVEREFSRRVPEFYGNTEPAATWRWLMEMEDVFRATRVGEGFKVRLAIKRLKGPAQDWWKSIVAERGRLAAYGMRWHRFRTLVVGKYRAGEYVKDLEREFFSFQLRWLSIEEYTTEFQRMLPLMRHLVHQGRDEVRYYAWGLPERYRVYVERQRHLDLAILCAKEVALHEVPIYEKAEEAERLRARRFETSGIVDNKCPRCGQPCELVIQCECLGIDCEECGDWRHTSVTCPEREQELA